MGRQRQQGQLCHNSWWSQLHSLVPNCSAGAAGAAPALPFAAPLLRTTNESAAISAVWADTHELETRYPKRVVCVLSCRVSFGPLRERVSRPVLGFGVFLGFWPARAGLGRFMSGLGWFGFLAGVRAGLGRFTSDLGRVQTSPGPAQTGPFALRSSAGGETACPAHRPPGNQENKR